MECPKCNYEMKKYFPKDGYANAWRCPKCNYICENHEPINDKIRFMRLLDSLGVEYVSGVTSHAFYDNQNGVASIIDLDVYDICICNKYYDKSTHNVPLNCLYNIILRFDNEGNFLGFTPNCAE